MNFFVALFTKINRIFGRNLIIKAHNTKQNKTKIRKKAKKKNKLSKKN